MAEYERWEKGWNYAKQDDRGERLVRAAQENDCETIMELIAQLHNTTFPSDDQRPDLGSFLDNSHNNSELMKRRRNLPSARFFLLSLPA